MTNSFFKIVSRTFILVLLCVPFFDAEAKVVVRSGDTVSIAEEQVIDDDFYAAGGKVSISGELEEDAVIAGGQITLNGSVGQNTLLVGGQVDVHGTVGGDLRVIAGEVTIAEPIMGDLFVMGGSVNILSTASVAGDVLLYAGQATIEGTVGGDVLGTLDKLRIDTTVAGDVDVTVTQLTLGDRTEVAGSVRYVSRELVVQSLNATVVGDLVRSDPVLPSSDGQVKSFLIPVLILLFSILVWFLVSRHSLQAVVSRAVSKSVRPIILGFVTVLFAPLAIGVLLFSVIGVFVGTAALLGLLLLLVLSFIGLTAVLGHLLMVIFNQPSAQLSLITLGVGVVAVLLLLLLPVVGQFVLFGIMILTLGSMVDLLFFSKRS